MYLAAMLPVFLHSGERGHVAALLTLANAPITGLVWVGGGGGRGGSRSTHGKFDIFRFSNVNFPTLKSPF